MNKEDILGKYPIVSNNARTGLYVSLESAHKAMEEYARQQVKEVQLWAKIEGYYIGFGNCWYDKEGEEIANNTEQLYDQFLEHQKQKNQ